MLWWRGHRSQVHKYPFSSIFPASTCKEGCKYSLIQNRTGDFGASFALLRRKALQPFPQTFATVPANVCNRSRKRLQPPLQTFASVIANVCGEKTPFCGIPSPHVFLLSRFPTVMLWVKLLSEVHLRWYSSVASALPIPQACCAMCAVDFLFHSSPCVV